MKLGVIDLGTNTFHLLIAELNENGQFTELYRKREYVYIGEEGVEKLGEKPMQRGYETLKRFKSKIDELEVERLKAVGTAALRRASNGNDFIQKINSEVGIKIETISGDEEARLIYLGVRQAIPMSDTVQMIMDIGGGSVEFIIANQSKIFWAKSFKIGVSVLYNHFHKNEPISLNETQQINEYLKTTLTPLLEILSQYEIKTLVGASGTFDVIASILGNPEKKYPHCQFTDIIYFPQLYDSVITSDLNKRLSMSDIPTQRAKLIPVALILINFILTHTSVNEICVSSYAIKEGILADMLS